MTALKLQQVFPVGVETRGLAYRLLVPLEADPFEVLQQRSFELRRAARRVDVLDAQEHPAAHRSRLAEVDERGAGVAQMKVAVGAGREAEGPHGEAPYMIRTDEDVSRGLEALAALDPRLAPVVEAHRGTVPLRWAPPGLEGLAQIVTAQQVSKASAAAIFARTRALVGPFDAATLLATPDEALRAVGQSRAKVATLKGIAEAIAGGLDLEALAAAPFADGLGQLVALKGIGPWTAEAFLLFCAGHPDVFPAGDLALQVAVGDVAGLSHRPNEKETRLIAAEWSPHRSVAARLMYEHYRTVTGRGAI